ncbi:right-handed parallel beta-helix repeat-containing protein [Owenweeksia hongkongensis]|uniref:right-handed parallel beta-helix repeat-containing protein n=1 Tax=Owenweeksia hongkongensis TaxID=253245 RepID=UPI003A8D5DB3
MKKNILLFFGTLISFLSMGQGTINTHAVYPDNNGSSAVSFEVESSTLVEITGISNVFNTGVSSSDVWVRVGGIASAPLNTAGNLEITAANGWVLNQTCAVAGGGGINSTPVPLQSFVPILVPVNTPIGIVITGGMRYSGTASPVSPTAFTHGPVTLRTGGVTGSTIYGYGGALPSALGNKPRGFLGTLTYGLVGPCTNPPVAGTAVANSGLVCVGGNVDLSLSGNTTGTGQTYQWQSSIDNVNWTNIAGATSALVTANPTVNTYYRAGVTCGVTTYSSSVQVLTQGGTLSGTYTINKNAPISATNYQSFADLATALSCGNITADVTVNVVANSGPYKERFVLGQINGAGPSARLIINGNGNELRDSTNTSNERTAFLLNGTDYLVLDSLNIVNKGTTYGWALQLTNGANNNIIRNCKLETSITSTSSNHCGLVMSSSLTSATTSGNSGSYNLIENNRIIGGYYALMSYATTTVGSRNVGNSLIRNKIEDAYYYSIYNSGQDSMTVIGNDISRPNRLAYGGGYGIYNSSVGNKSQFSHNWIHDMFKQATGTTTALYGIYSSASDNTPSAECLVFNNLMSDNQNNGAHYYIYNTSSDGWKYYHNTIVANSPGSTAGLTRGFYQLTLATGIEFKNNLISINRGGSGPHHAIYAGTTTSVMDIDRNAYFMANAGSGNDHYGYYTSNQSTFANWQTASSYDANSAIGDPLFDANTLYQPTAAYFNNIGLNLQSIVSSDFGGVLRGPAPDPGIWEFSPPPGPDLSIASISQLGASCGSSTNLVVRLINVGTDTVLSATLNYTVNGIPQTPILLSGVFATGLSVYDTLYNIPLTANTNNTVVATLVSIGPGVDTDPGNNAFATNVRPGYSGNLYINSLIAANDSTFTSFTSLAAALMANGVCGPIAVTVAPNSGPYNEQFAISTVEGVSSVNQVVINGNGRTLQYSAGNSSERGTVLFNGTDWFTINNLMIKATGATYGFGVSFTNNADHNTLSNCTVLTDSMATSSNYCGVVISGSAGSATTSGSCGNYNTIINNNIVGGYYGIIAYGSSTDSLNGNQFINNQVRDFYYGGIYNYYSRGSVINSNEIHRPNRTSNTTFYGIYAYVNHFSKIIGNKVHDPFPLNTTTTSTAYGIYAYSFMGSSANYGILANNLIYNFNSAGTQYLFSPYLTSYAKVIHNTVIADDANSTGTSGSTYVIYNPGISEYTYFQNNLAYLNRKVGTGTSYMFYQSGAVGASSVIDKNVYYAPSTFTVNTFGYYGGSAVTSFQNWKNTTRFDQISEFTRPYFVNMGTGNFVPQSKVIDGLGVDFTADVSVDINNVARTVPVDPGAFEFTGAPCTGVGGLATSNITANSATVSWSSDPAGVKIEWGPVGFKQASIVGTIITVPVGTSTTNITGLNGNTCYDYYVTPNCTSTIPGAPSVMGPYTFCTPCAGGGLNAGTYTVGGAAGPSNFASIDSVIDVLNGCGIKGPVVFNVQAGSYVVSKTIGEIDGASAINTITFDGSATIADTLRGNGTAVIDLDGAKHFVFKGLSIINNTARGIWLHNSADSNTVEDCYIRVSTTGTGTVMAGIVASTSATGLSAGADVDYLKVTNNTIVGGYYGIVSYGNGTTSKMKGAVIENNTLLNQYSYGIYAYYNQDITIKKNSVNGLRNTASYGFYMVYTDNFYIEGNQISDAKTYGVYLSSANSGLSGVPATKSTFINNMVLSTGSGCYFTGISYLNVFHNTVEGAYGYRQFTPTSVDVRNNIFVGSSNYAFESGTAVVTPNVVNYNLYHKRGGTDLIKDGTPTYTSLALWKTALPLLNVNSVEGAPIFITPTDLHVVGSLANDAGDNTVGVLVDIDGDVRPANGSTVVDLGADEFTPLNFDIAVTAIASNPGSGSCGDALTQVDISLANYGLSSLSGIPLTAVISGAVNTTLTTTYAGPLSTLGTITLNLGPINTTGGGVYNVEVHTNLSNDQDRSNDTVTTTFTFKNTLAPSVTAAMDTFCAGAYDTLYAPIGTADNYEWKDINGVVLGTGDTLVVGPLLAADTTFTLSSVSQQYRFGPVSNSIGVAANFTDPSVQQLYFTAIQAFTLDSITVYPNANGNVNINLVDFTTNAILQTVTVPVTGVTAAGTKQRIAVGMNIPAGTYKMHGGGSTTGGLWRNSAGAVYPYTASGVASITGHSFSASGPDYYYYFYDWKITSGGCPRPDGTKTLYASSASQVPAFTSNVQGATMTGQVVDFDASSSQGATSYSWNFGDGNTGTGVMASHTYTANGSYTVTLTITGPCGTQTITSTVVVQGIGIEGNVLSSSLRVYPNPSNGVVNISFQTEASDKARVRITDMAGKELMYLVKDNINGHFEGTVDIGKLPKGVYLLEISSDNLSTQERLIKD